MRAVVIAAVNLRRLLRDRIGLFFIFVLPVVMMVMLGTIYGGRTAPRIGIVVVDEGRFATELVTAIADGEVALEVQRPASADGLRAAVEEGSVELGLIVPGGYDATLRDGGRTEVEVLGRSATALSALRRAVDTAVAGQAARVRAARLVQSEAGLPFEVALGLAARVQAATPAVGVGIERLGEGIFPDDTAAFAPGAQSQLVLFMFLTSMTAATQVILTRQLGVSRRMLAAPIGVTTIVIGEILGRFGVAMLQGLFIVLLSTVIFGVPWGDPLAAGLLVVTFALVGTGAAMVVGVFANNADQAGALGVMAGMLLGALGGAMVPLEIFPEPIHTLAFLSPHAWVIQGLRSVSLRGGDIVEIVPELLALTLYALGLIALGTWRFRRVLSR